MAGEPLPKYETVGVDEEYGHQDTSRPLEIIKPQPDTDPWLAPFAVDNSSLSETIPAIDEIFSDVEQVYLETGYGFSEGTTAREACKSLFGVEHARRHERSVSSRQMERAEKPTSAMLRFVAFMDAEQQKQVIHEILNENIKHSPLRNTLKRGLDESVKYSVIYRALYEGSFKVVDQYNESLVDDVPAEVQEYQLLKTFASIQPSPNEEPTDSTDPAVTLTTMLYIDADSKEGEPALPDSLFDRLQAGEYEDLIASDFLHYVSGNSSFEDPKLDEAANQIRFIHQMMRTTLGADVNKDTLINSIVSNKDNWPLGIQAGFKEARKRLIGQTGGILRLVTEQLIGDNFISESGDNEQDFIEGLHDVEWDFERLKAKKLGAQAARGSMARIKHEDALSAVQSKRRRKQQSAATKEKAEETEPEKIKEPRKLGYLDDKGVVHSADSEKYSELIEDFMDKKPNQVELQSDIDKILKYISEIDFSTRVNGVTKYGGTVQLGEGKTNVFGLKPQDAPGLSTKTKIVKKHRILFSFVGEDQVAILGIVPRPELGKFGENIGLGRMSGD